ncbi:type II CAAX endopeptidase family protein [Vibrio mytili]|uniref:CPBP family intramembrane glutamic endopeptidase n=1 Tax=Vibrio mytili TaxID=50718 RepID=UPI002F3F3ED0
MSKTEYTSHHISWLERAGDDFPFYNDSPTHIDTKNWLVILLGVAIGFTVLTVDMPLLKGEFAGVIRSILFFAIPLVVYHLVAKPFFHAIFRKLSWRSVGVMFFIALLNLVVTVSIGAIFLNTLGAESNAALVALKDQDLQQRLLFLLQSIPQLFGEEVLTILPFLAFLYVGYSKLGLSRRMSVLLAWFLSSLVFGLVHLPSYNWNWAQCIVVIGSARLILSLAYIRTKNIWVSTGAHIINDWVIFLLVMAAA